MLLTPVFFALAIFGVVATVVAGLSLTSKILGLSEELQPLGLPEGSVRALTTLLILTSFVGFVFYAVSAGSDRGTPSVIQGLTEGERQKLVATVPAGSLVYVTPWGDVKLQKFTVAYYPDNGPRKEMIGQVLAAFGAITSSILAFYFGSRVGAAGGAPSSDSRAGTSVILLSVTPATLSVSGGIQSLTVSGTGLERANGMLLVPSTGGNQLIATDVLSDQTRVTGKFSIAGAALGSYSLIVTSTTGETTRYGQSIIMQ